MSLEIREMFTFEQSKRMGYTISKLKWEVEKGRLHRLCRGIYLRGNTLPTALEKALGQLVAVDGVASATLAASLYELDEVTIIEPYVTLPAGKRNNRSSVCTRVLYDHQITEVKGIRCTDIETTLLDLAKLLSDDHFEIVLESAFRKRLLKFRDAWRIPHARAKRVLQKRGDVPPTGSNYETRVAQLLRTCPDIPEPIRQFAVGMWFVDFAWPKLDVFLEVDGSQHCDQWQHDVNRQTGIVVHTGWLPLRVTCREIERTPRTVLRRIKEVLEKNVA